VWEADPKIFSMSTSVRNRGFPRVSIIGRITAGIAEYASG
jgi:hypothetical protein